jgi:phosphatidylglycerol---prolipoprotein diacylglyceryl transferase
MFPTMFKIPYLPDWLADIKSYGVMMMIAFLSGIWLACRRANKSQANPDIVLNMGFIALICGVIGARAMFVIHYWDTNFANQPHPIWAIFDIRAGGLEFYGGPLLVIPALMVYLRYIAKASVRWYLDITMPSLAWGLAITRIGCFLNGCCWGSLCVDEHDPAHHRAAVPGAVRFPYGSPAMVQQYEFGQLAIPKELILTAPNGISGPVPPAYIDEYCKEQATQAGKSVRLPDGSPLTAVESRCKQYGLTADQLARFATAYRSKPVHPAQLYETIGGFIICWVLTRMFYYRTRHGILGAWFLMLYGIMRFMLELIRQDNPLDVGGLTISQAIAIGTFAVGLLWLWVVYKRMPPVSPLVVPFEPPEEEQEERPQARKA